MLKLIAALLIVLSSIAVSEHYNHRLLARRNTLRSLIAAIRDASSNMRYTHDDLKALFSHAVSSSFFENDAPFSACWRTLVASVEKVLSPSDRELLLSFGDRLGKTDEAAESEHIRYTLSRLERQLAEAEDAYKTKSKLYRVFGFCGGTALSLLII